MITSDAIRCLIPSDSAIKGAELFCSTSNPVSSADSQTWASWAGVAVSLIAAAVTLLAVIVAIKQSKDAKLIAENSNKEAINRELMSRQWDRYEAFSQETILMMQHLGAEPNEYARLMTNQTHAGNSYVMYLSLEHRTLSKAVMDYSDALQGIGSTLNALNAAVIAGEEFDGDVIDWTEGRPKFQKECMQNAALLVNELRSFYQRKTSPEKVTQNLSDALRIIVMVHKPLLTHYEKDQPVFMRKYS